MYKAHENCTDSWSFYANSVFEKWGLYKTAKGMHSEAAFNPGLPQFYREVLMGYCHNNAMAVPYSREKVLNETLWGNSNLKDSTKKGLYFINWIQSGFIRVKDLKIDAGKIDESYVMKSLKKKHNCYCEILQLKQALKNYLGIAANHVPDIRSNIKTEFSETSKVIYNKLVSKKSQSPISKSRWLDRFNTRHINFKDTYYNKVKRLRDKKVAEFNFKLLHNILPCNSKLHSWGIHHSNTCAFCDQIETVDHILFSCKDVVHLWNKLLPLFNMNDLNIYEMIFECSDLTMTWVLSLIQQKVFKRWVLYHNQKSISGLEYFLYQELQYKLYLYEQNDYTDICKLLRHVLSLLR